MGQHWGISRAEIGLAALSLLSSKRCENWEDVFLRVCKANKRDLDWILMWLGKEYHDAGGEGFWCNHGVIQSSFEEGDLWVIRKDGEAIAFQVGSYAADIACIRRAFQRQGFGKALFAASLARAKRDDVNVLWGECSPISSFPFWRGLGFEQYNDPGSPAILVRRVVGRRFKLPKGRPPSAVQIGFYPEEALYRPGVAAISQYQPRAVLLEDGLVRLGQRIIGIILGGGRDLVIRIEVDGIERCFCKAKYDEATSAGVRYDGPGRNFFVDAVHPTSS